MDFHICPPMVFWPVKPYAFLICNAYCWVATQQVIMGLWWSITPSVSHQGWQEQTMLEEFIGIHWRCVWRAVKMIKKRYFLQEPEIKEYLVKGDRFTKWRDVSWNPISLNLRSFLSWNIHCVLFLGPQVSRCLWRVRETRIDFRLVGCGIQC